MSTCPSKGFTLTSTLFVVLVTGALGVAIASKLSREGHEVNLDATGTKVEALHNAVKMHYDRNCDATVYVQPTVGMLVDDGYLYSQSVIEVPEIGAPSINVVNPGAINVQFEYSLNFIDERDARYIESSHHNTTRVGLQVTFTYGNHAIDRQAGIEAMQLMGAFGSGLCG